LLAEAAEQAPIIERFRDSKAEHNTATLAQLLEIKADNVKAAVKPLIELGFLEEIGESYKVPMLYRDGLNISQGKAFSSEDRSTEE
jgi:Mn-dependent DtxR family transcriptional regulator